MPDSPALNTELVTGQGEGVLTTRFTGRVEGESVEALVTKSLAAEKPVAILCEPLPGPVRLKPFSGLIVPEHWEEQAEAELLEARIFHKAGMLHLLRIRAEVRWCAWIEGEGNDPPSWAPPGGDGPVPTSLYRGAPSDLWLAGGPLPSKVARNDSLSKAVTEERRRGGAVDRGLSQARVDRHALQTIEYAGPRGLVWWTLTTRED